MVHPELEHSLDDFRFSRPRTSCLQVEVIEKGESERRTGDVKKRKEEVDFLKYQGQHLDSFLKQIGGSK